MTQNEIANNTRVATSPLTLGFIVLGATSLLGGCAGGAQWARAVPPLSSAAALRASKHCCSRQKTLFVVVTEGGTNLLGVVYGFDYNTGQLLMTLPPPPEGWNYPMGACSDSSGNVYIANHYSQTVDEYSHSGAYIFTISVPGQYPTNCAFDRSTGTLAIANFASYGFPGAGSIVIYANGKESAPLQPTDMTHPYSLAYQGNTGRLWIDGAGLAGEDQYDSYFKGAFAVVPIQGAAISYACQVMWSAQTRTMIVGDQYSFHKPITFYSVDSKGNVTGETTLDCPYQNDACGIPAATVKGPGIVVADNTNGTVKRFPYPAGGSYVINYSVPP